MNHLLYLLVIAAAMLGLSRILPGFQLTNWIAALFASLVLGAVNALVKPILFVITLPLTLLTLGLFLLVLNMICLWLTSLIVPGFVISDTATSFIASLILAAVGLAWKLIEPKK